MKAEKNGIHAKSRLDGDTKHLVEELVELILTRLASMCVVLEVTSPRGVVERQAVALLRMRKRSSGTGN